MKYNSYEDYVKDARTYFEGRELKVPVELMILPKNLFDSFCGIIEFGPGSKNLVNKCKCNCSEKCANHKE